MIILNLASAMLGGNLGHSSKMSNQSKKQWI